MHFLFSGNLKTKFHSGILESFIGYENHPPKAINSIQDDLGDCYIDTVTHRTALHGFFKLST